jgi:hypothetical protein
MRNWHARVSRWVNRAAPVANHTLRAQARFWTIFYFYRASLTFHLMFSLNVGSGAVNSSPGSDQQYNVSIIQHLLIVDLACPYL